MHKRSRINFATRYVFLGLIMLSVPPLLRPASAAMATAHFEVYGDGVGIFLAKIDRASAPGKLVLFLHMGTIGGRYLGRGKWSTIYVLPDGCVPDGKCESIADGRLWIDAPDTPDPAPKRISGKYEINLNGKRLEGTFAAKRHDRRHPLRLCM
jgi:hypothetical protein